MSQWLCVTSRRLTISSQPAWTSHVRQFYSERDWLFAVERPLLPYAEESSCLQRWVHRCHVSEMGRVCGVDNLQSSSLPLPLHPAGLEPAGVVRECLP